MKLNFTILFAALVLLPTFQFAHASSETDDRDLSGPNLGVLRRAQQNLGPDQILPIANHEGLKISVKLDGNPIEGLEFSLTNEEGRIGSTTTNAKGSATFIACTYPGKQVRLSADLKTSHFSITDGSNTYRIQFAAVCGSEIEAIFEKESDGGQALGIWKVAYAAKKKLAATVGLSFWQSSFPFVWPDSADYYSWGAVHISKGFQWDVIGHEMGHAIYDIAKIGSFGGGQHKIDECYSDALALSEGWASYFSAWVSLQLNDPDAKFEYMVPRRAPIRYENVPEDVCKGPKNEWRVGSFLWDLIDTHNDGETSDAAFTKVWMTLLNSRSKNMNDVMSHLERTGFDRALMDLVWELNFKTPRGSPF